MRIEIMNRKTASLRSSNERHEDKVIISISTPHQEKCYLDQTNPTVKDVLKLEFFDCDSSDSKTIPEHYIFSSTQAYEIFNFVMKWKDKVDSIWVHCDGGVSRSAAVAAAILKAFTGDDELVFNNPKYYPNMLVYSKLLKTLTYELQLIQKK